MCLYVQVAVSIFQFSSSVTDHLKLLLWLNCLRNVEVFDCKRIFLRCYDANLIERSELSTDDKTEGVLVETLMRRLDRNELLYV